MGTLGGEGGVRRGREEAVECSIMLWPQPAPPLLTRPAARRAATAPHPAPTPPPRHFSFLTFSSRMSSGCRLSGFSMATKASSWARWFWMTSRTMPAQHHTPEEERGAGLLPGGQFWQGWFNTHTHTTDSRTTHRRNRNSRRAPWSQSPPAHTQQRAQIGRGGLECSSKHGAGMQAGRRSGSWARASDCGALSNPCSATKIILPCLP